MLTDEQTPISEAHMSDDFYPFVDSGDPAPDNSHLTGVVQQEGTDQGFQHGSAAIPETEGAAKAQTTYTTRISVYDDMLSTPRVIVVERDDIRTYLEEITNTVYRTMKEQGGRLSLMVIRELVENFIHAHFTEPIISILDGGNTIRFADQGPGIGNKERAFEFGVTSADREQKRYIRGTGSGLPMVQEYLENAGGAISIEDNLGCGTVVTVSVDPTRVGEIGQTSLRGAAVRPHEAAGAVGAGVGIIGGMGASMPTGALPGGAGAMPGTPAGASAAGAMPASGAGAAGMAPQPFGGGAGWPGVTQQWPAYGQAPGYGQAAYGFPAPAYPAAPTAAQGYPQYGQQFSTSQQFPAQMGYPYPTQPMPAQAPSPATHAPTVSERGMLALSAVAERGMAGPTDLAQAFGESVPTWSRELAKLTTMGLVRKHGQKHVMTEAGAAWMQQQHEAIQ